MKNQLRTILTAWKETPFARLRASDHRSFGYDRLTEQIAAATEYTVLHGPYRGMRYFGPPGVPLIDEHPTTKLIGSFEEELHPWIESLIKPGVGNVVHLGSGEGYHAVGLARRMPGVRSFVFDTLLASRKACKTLAEQNGVRDRVQLRGFCGADAFLDVELAGSLIFSDCGGAELTLLDPLLYPSLNLATMLVETHDAFDSRVTSRLVSRFSGTHRIEFVSAVARDPKRYSLLNAFPEATARMALDEGRTFTKEGKPQRWALLSPYVA